MIQEELNGIKTDSRGINRNQEELKNVDSRRFVPEPIRNNTINQASDRIRPEEGSTGSNDEEPELPFLVEKT